MFPGCRLSSSSPLPGVGWRGRGGRHPRPVRKGSPFGQMASEGHPHCLWEAVRGPLWLDWWWPRELWGTWWSVECFREGEGLQGRRKWLLTAGGLSRSRTAGGPPLCPPIWSQSRWPLGAAWTRPRCVCAALWGLATLEVPQCYYSVALQVVQFYLVCQCGLPSTVPTDQLSWRETCAHLIQGANKGSRVPEQVNSIVPSLFSHQTLAILRILRDHTSECCRLGRSYQPAGASPICLLDPQAHCLLPPHVTLVAPEISAGRTLGLTLCGYYSGLLACTLYSQQVVCFISRKEKQRALKTFIHPCPPQPVTQPLGLPQRRELYLPQK